METNLEQWAEAKRWMGRLPRADFEKLLLLMNQRFDDGIEAIQAAFAERETRLVEALSDLVSWFPTHGPIYADWLIRGGQYGADDAVNHARATLAALKDRTHG